MRKKILLIEDDQIVRENTAEILELANYEVLTAENGKMGLEKANVFKPDLIICDILMPELDGYGVMQIAMRNEELQRIPIIFMSAKTKHEDIRKVMDLGASDYITKPFEESELLSAVAADGFGELKGLIERHVAETRSRRAADILQHWDIERAHFLQVGPKEMLPHLKYPLGIESGAASA